MALMVDRTCLVCGKHFQVRAAEAKRGRGKLCSRTCVARRMTANRDQRGERNPNWSGGPDQAEKARRYLKRWPEKKRAHDAVKAAIKRGELVRGACAECGEFPGQAHHEDYSRPLDVIWLCRTHHTARHNGSRPGLKV